MKKLISTALMLTLFAGSVFTGCSNTNDSSSGTTSSPEGTTSSIPDNSDPYKIGVFLRFSDEAGVRMRKTIEHAVSTINSDGGINGHDLEVIYYDDEGDASKSIDAVTRLISQDNVLVAVGPTTSTCALAVIDMAAQYEIPIITPQSTNTTITSEYGNEWFFRNSVADIYHSYSLCDYIVNDLGAKKIAFVHETGTLGLGQYENFVERLSDEYNMEIAIEQQWNEGDVDFKTQLLAVKEAEPDVIIFAGHEAELAIATNQRLDVGISEDVPLLGFSSMSSSDYYGVAGDSAVGAIFTSTFSPTDTRDDIAAFVSEYTPVIGAAPDHNAAQAYDTILLLKETLEKITLTNTEASLAADREAIRDALAQVNGYVGLSGVTTFGTGGGAEDRDGKKVCSIYQLQSDYTWSVVKAAE
ncbi:MAG: ABC transporter substrate-binding protein [Oscillospiraceae bacterium]|jgi:ABC-type branched-subunit amino acid transport system substrate-binding protein